MSTKVTTPKTVISDKSVKAQRILNNSKAKATIEEIKAAQDAAADDDETDAVAHDKEVLAAAKKDVKATKGKTTKVVSKKTPKVKVISCYGAGTELMCKNPKLSYVELLIAVKKATGIEKVSAVRTAHTNVRHIISLLQASGLMK